MGEIERLSTELTLVSMWESAAARAGAGEERIGIATGADAVVVAVADIML